MPKIRESSYVKRIPFSNSDASHITFHAPRCAFQVSGLTFQGMQKPKFAILKLETRNFPVKPLAVTFHEMHDPRGLVTNGREATRWRRVSEL